MGPENLAIGASLAVLTALLVVLFVRDLLAFARTRSYSKLGWGLGLALAAAALGVETVVYLGWEPLVLLRAYYFFSAAIVGVLSLGALRVVRTRVLRLAYTAYATATTVLVGGASFLLPLPTGLVHDGIITGTPGLWLVVLSSLVTVPATAVLLVASAVALRRSRSWPTILLVSGALILGAGGTLDLASFPVALYYAEFSGIVLLFFGVVNLPTVSSSASAAAHPRPGA